MWLELRLHFVTIDRDQVDALLDAGQVPREDVDVYLTAIAGEADCFVSSNHELVRTLASEGLALQCLTPEEFVAQHLPGRPGSEQSPTT